MTTSLFNAAVLAEELGERHVLLVALCNGYLAYRIEFAIVEFRSELYVDWQVYLVGESHTSLCFRTKKDKILMNAIFSVQDIVPEERSEESPVFRSVRSPGRPSSEMMSDLFEHFAVLEAG